MAVAIIAVIFPSPGSAQDMFLVALNRASRASLCALLILRSVHGLQQLSDSLFR